MADTERGTAVGVFADRTHAEYAMDDLRAAGFRDDQVGFLVPDAPAEIEAPAVERGSRAGEGAATGAAAGGALGGLIGAALATAVIPGVGPVIAGGLLAGVVGGALTGIAGGGIFGALVGLEIPEEDARRYEGEFHSGRTLVTVRAGDRYDEAAEILRRAAERPEHAPHGRSGAAHLHDEGQRPPGMGSAVVPRP